jgi:5-methyltetrahydropteroyltriglutamate--homocysteine methyltransferase
MRCRPIFALRKSPSSSGTGDLPAIGNAITDKKVVIGVIDHHTLQIERPDQVADLIREASQHIPPERLIISSDCGMGREGMSRRHAQYKMVAMVLGTNIVKKELGIPERPNASPRIPAILWRSPCCSGRRVRRPPRSID